MYKIYISSDLMKKGNRWALCCVAVAAEVVARHASATGISLQGLTDRDDYPCESIPVAS